MVGFPCFFLLNDWVICIIMNIHWKDWCWSWNSNTLATWCEELTRWKRSWCWERLKAWGEGDDRGWDGWMASPTQWTWVWVVSRSWWWTGRPGVLQSMGLQRVGHDWATELNWAYSGYHSHQSYTQSGGSNFPKENQEGIYVFKKREMKYLSCLLPYSR